MTVKKAIEILDWWINHKRQSMEQLKVEWNYDSDKVTELAKSLMHSEETAIYNLEKIKTELVPNCKHPKKMIDTLPDGQKYCMNCNLDL